jgi:hypothetical protein
MRETYIKQQAQFVGYPVSDE